MSYRLCPDNRRRADTCFLFGKSCPHFLSSAALERSGMSNTLVSEEPFGDMPHLAHHIASHSVKCLRLWTTNRARIWVRLWDWAT